MTNEPQIATLIVSRWYTKCSWCGRQSKFSSSTAHNEISGYGEENRPGCGARFVSVTSDNLELTDEMRARLAQMRPDLPIVEWADRVKPPLPGFELWRPRSTRRPEER